MNGSEPILDKVYKYFKKTNSMEISYVKWLVSKMPGLRLTDDEVDRISADYEELTGTTDPLDFRKFFWILYDTSISRAVQKKSAGQTKQEEQLKQHIEKLENRINSQLEKIQATSKQADELKALKESFDIYVVCLEKSTGGKVKNLHDFIDLLLAEYHKRGYLKISKEDQEYYNSVVKGG